MIKNKTIKFHLYDNIRPFLYQKDEGCLVIDSYKEDPTKYDLIKELLKNNKNFGIFENHKSNIDGYNRTIVKEEEIEYYKSLDIKDLDDFFTLKFPIENEIYDKNGDFQKLKILPEHKDFDLIFRTEYNNHEYFNGIVKYIAYKNDSIYKDLRFFAKKWTEEIREEFVKHCKNEKCIYVKLVVHSSPLIFSISCADEFYLDENGNEFYPNEQLTE